MDKIKSAAIWLENGCVLTLPPPNRHHNILSAKRQDMKLRDIKIREQGFQTEERFFVNRKDAWTIAKEAGQILPDDKRINTETDGTLYSEDLW